MGHLPLRTCILCRQKQEKTSLIRIVKNESGFSVDENQKKEGRGAYICCKCKESGDLLKKRVLDRAFKQRIPDEVYDLLKGE